MSEPLGHIPVLRDSCVALLAPRQGQTYVDCTAGLGGHAAAIAPALGSGGHVVLNDVDPGNLARAEAAVRRACAESQAPRVSVIRGNFAQLPRALARMGIHADVVLADLGFSSNQMDDAERGMSFMREGPLDMRLDPSLAVTAAEIVNTRPADELIEILREFGEERQATAIVRKLVRARADAPITTTSQLAAIVRAAFGPGARSAGIDPATRTFQALRIAVNDELGVLEALMAVVERESEMMAKGGATPRESAWLNHSARIGVISFHSLEDRVVKRCFARLCGGGLADDVSNGICEASPNEIEQNPRSRSAKLRVIRLRDPDGARTAGGGVGNGGAESISGR